MPFRRSWGYRLWEKVALHLSDHIDVDGLWVGALDTDSGPSSRVLDKTRQALELIKLHDPYRYRLVLTEVSSLWVNLLPGDRSEWVPKDKRCILDSRIVLGETVDQVAASIIHEAMNARLCRRGVTDEDYVRRQQIESVCMRQELAFAARLPNGAQLTAWIDGRMALPADFWAARSVRARQAVGEAQVAQYAHVPDWVMRAALAVRRFRAWIR